MNNIAIQNGRFSLTAYWQQAGRDILVLVTGGQIPHLGAVAIAEPRLSKLTNSKQLSATASVFCYFGHKEDKLTRKLALKLASSLGVKVIVAAGIHWDNLKLAEIKKIITTYYKLEKKLLDILTNNTRKY